MRERERNCVCFQGDVSRAALQFPAALSESRAPTLLTLYSKPSETARPQVKSFGEISSIKRIFLSLEGWLVVTSAGWSLLQDGHFSFLLGSLGQSRLKILKYV